MGGDVGQVFRSLSHTRTMVQDRYSRIDNP